MAVKWDPEEIAAYSGFSITKIKFYPTATKSAIFAVKVWQGEDSTLLHTQDVTGVVGASPPRWLNLKKNIYVYYHC